MKNKLLLTAAMVAVAGVASAALYMDATGDEFSGNTILDIVSVEVQNDASDIMFTINVVGDPSTTDWGKYLVAIDSVAGGDTAGNGWNRPISMASGMDYWIGSWVDTGGGSQTWSYDGSVWNQDHVGVPSVTANSVTLTTSLASLGLGISDTITFDVFTSGGNGTDGAMDALSDPATIGDWGTPYNSTSTLTYTVIPEPGTLGLLGIAGVGLLFARRKLLL